MRSCSRLVALLCLFFPAPVPAQASGEKSLVVMGVDGNLAPEQRRQLDGVMRTTATSALAGQGWSVVQQQLMPATLMGMGEEADLCERGKCRVQHIGMFAAQAGLRAEIMRVDTTFYVTVYLHNVDSPGDSAEVSVQSAGPRLELDLKAAVDKALRGGLGVAGREPPATGGRVGNKALLVVAERVAPAKVFSISNRAKVLAPVVSDLGAKSGHAVLFADEKYFKGMDHLDQDGRFSAADLESALRASGAFAAVVVRVVATRMEVPATPDENDTMFSINLQVSTFAPGNKAPRAREPVEFDVACGSSAGALCGGAFTSRVASELQAALAATAAAR